MGDFDANAIQSVHDWWWGEPYERGRTYYMFEYENVIKRLTRQGPFFTFNHSGHGINSYGLNLVTSRGPIAVFVQHGFGGAYSDPVWAREQIAATYARVQALFDRIVDPDAELRWLLLHSHFRSIRGVIDLEQYGRDGSFAIGLDPNSENIFEEPKAKDKGISEEDLFEYLLKVPGLTSDAGMAEFDWASPPVPDYSRYANPPRR